MNDMAPWMGLLCFRRFTSTSQQGDAGVLVSYPAVCWIASCGAS